MPPTDCSITPKAPPPRVVAPYARTLWDAARAEGVPQVLGREAPGEEDMPVSDYLALLQQALAHAGPGFGWRLGQSVKHTTYGVNGILLLACPTLGEALQQVLRFESLGRHGTPRHFPGGAAGFADSAGQQGFAAAAAAPCR